MVNKAKAGMYMQAIRWKTIQIRERFGRLNQFDKMQKLNKPVLYTGNIFSDVLIVGRDLGKEEVEGARPRPHAAHVVDCIDVHHHGGEALDQIGNG